MRSVDLAVYADAVAAEAGVLSARLERGRRRLRQAAIEREARLALPGETVARLERLGLLGAGAGRDDAAEVVDAQLSLRAIDELQAWIEERLYAAPEASAAAA